MNKSHRFHKREAHKVIASLEPLLLLFILRLTFSLFLLLKQLTLVDTFEGVREEVVTVKVLERFSFTILNLVCKDVFLIELELETTLYFFAQVMYCD